MIGFNVLRAHGCRCQCPPQGQSHASVNRFHSHEIPPRETRASSIPESCFLAASTSSESPTPRRQKSTAREAVVRPSRRGCDRLVVELEVILQSKFDDPATVLVNDLAEVGLR